MKLPKKLAAIFAGLAALAASPAAAEMKPKDVYDCGYKLTMGNGEVADDGSESAKVRGVQCVRDVDGSYIFETDDRSEVLEIKDNGDFSFGRDGIEAASHAGMVLGVKENGRTQAFDIGNRLDTEMAGVAMEGAKPIIQAGLLSMPSTPRRLGK